MIRLLAVCIAVSLVAVLAWLFVKANTPQPLTPPDQRGPGKWSTSVPLIAPPVGTHRL
jgi:hypothetical protein